MAAPSRSGASLAPARLYGWSSREQLAPSTKRGARDPSQAALSGSRAQQARRLAHRRFYGRGGTGGRAAKIGTLGHIFRHSRQGHRHSVHGRRPRHGLRLSVARRPQPTRGPRDARANQEGDPRMTTSKTIGIALAVTLVVGSAAALAQ